MSYMLGGFCGAVVVVLFFILNNLIAIKYTLERIDRHIVEQRERMT